MLAVAVFPKQRELRLLDLPEPGPLGAVPARPRMLDFGDPL